MHELLTKLLAKFICKEGVLLEAFEQRTRGRTQYRLCDVGCDIT